MKLGKEQDGGRLKETLTLNVSDNSSDFIQEATGSWQKILSRAATRFNQYLNKSSCFTIDCFKKKLDTAGPVRIISRHEVMRT